MNGVDVVILVILVLGVVNGLRIGFIVEAATLFGLVIALAAAKALYPSVRQVLQQGASSSPWLTPISYLIPFLVVLGAVAAVARLMRRAARLLAMGGIDRLGGAILGFLQAAVLVELLLYLGKRARYHDLHILISQSRLAPNFLSLVPYIDHLFPHMPRYFG